MMREEDGIGGGSGDLAGTSGHDRAAARERAHPDLIIIGSLVDRLPNLGTAIYCISSELVKLMLKKILYAYGFTVFIIKLPQQYWNLFVNCRIPYIKRPDYPANWYILSVPVLGAGTGTSIT
jgi:hypothetical protein